MKKLVSFLTAVALTASLPVFSVYAEGNTDLESMAFSLGADKDYLAVKNMSYPVSEYSSDKYLPIVECERLVLESGNAYYGDTSLGASVMSILVHNGIISASDIKEGAESLSKINHILLAKKAIYKYQNIFDNEDFQTYMTYLQKRQTTAQKADSLVSTAEKCMSEGRYFLIMYAQYSNLELTSRCQKVHSAVGIGVADGSWTFEDKTYDKCILTLDSLSVDEENDAFSEDTCIYINSETKEYYVPKFSVSDMQIIAIDNDQLLNGEDTDVVDEINEVHTQSGAITEIKYTDENGNEVIMNNDNEFLDNYHSSFIPAPLIKGSNIRINTLSKSWLDTVSIINKKLSIEFEMRDSDSEVICNENSIKLIKNNNEKNIHRDFNDPLDYWVHVTPAPTSSPDIYYSINGETMGMVEFTKTDDGVIFSGGKAQFMAFKRNEEYAENPTENDPYERLFFLAFDSADKVFVKFNESGDPTLFADLDQDDVFEYEVQKGDVNCDGRIDAVDASSVLSAYADLSTMSEDDEKRIYASAKYADMNSDGNIDAVDASEILSIYAENSTK